MTSKKKSKFVTQDIDIDQIITDISIQPRDEIREDIIFNYANVLSEGGKLPPIDVFKDEKGYWPGDGLHRLEAYILEGRESIPARVYPGGRREALIHASSANLQHGLLRTNRDKRRAVENVLKDQGMCGYSDTRIAEMCKVSQPFVGKLRRLLTQNGYKFPEKRITKNNVEMDVSGFSSARPSPDPDLQNSTPEISEVNQEATITNHTLDSPTINQLTDTEPAEQNRQTVDFTQTLQSAEDNQNESKTLPETSAEMGSNEEAASPPIEPQENENEIDETENELTATRTDSIDDSNNPSEVADQEDIDQANQLVLDLELQLAEAKTTITEKEELIDHLKMKIIKLEKENAYYRKELSHFSEVNEQPFFLSNQVNESREMESALA